MDILRLPIAALRQRIAQEIADNACLDRLENDPAASGQDVAPVQSVAPDVFVEVNEQRTHTHEHGKYRVRLADAEPHGLYVSPFYDQLLSSGDTPAETRDYIRQKVAAARSLIDSIERRAAIVRRVVQAIIDHQQPFLDGDAGDPDPLALPQIAAAAGIDEATLHRAVSEKWVQTPRGLFPLQHFFRGSGVSPHHEDGAAR